MMDRYSIVIRSDVDRTFKSHLIRSDGQEDLCFATYKKSTADKRLTAIITELILPMKGERDIHGNVGFYPQYLERALKFARDRNEGLVFCHSHPAPGWQGMSLDDVIAERRMAPAAMSFTDHPLVGMTVGDNGSWSGRFWARSSEKARSFECCWCESVRVQGKKLSITFNDQLLPAKFDIHKQLRTISAWGKQTQEDLSRMRIGIVGLGSVGSIVATILARTGFSNFVLIDFDGVEEKNLDRSNYLVPDIGRAKVSAVADSIRRSSTSPKVHIEEVEYSVCEKEGYFAALGCDAIFSCVDRPWPRQVLNYISYNHLIPVIDGGILVRTNNDNSRLIGADWSAHTIGFKRTCLECLGQYKTEKAILEKGGYLDDPSYIRGLENKELLEVHENVYAFSSHLASLEVLQLLNLYIAPSGLADVGQQTYHFVTGSLDREKNQECFEGCYFQQNVGLGDSNPVVVYARHPIAELARRWRERKELNSDELE